MPASPPPAPGGAPGPKALADPKQLALAQALDDGGTIDVATICRTLGISRATLYRYVRPHRREQPAGS
jgi:hypothetical protein